jgi:hypothetical protein
MSWSVLPSPIVKWLLWYGKKNMVWQDISWLYKCIQWANCESNYRFLWSIYFYDSSVGLVDRNKKGSLDSQTLLPIPNA